MIPTILCDSSTLLRICAFIIDGLFARGRQRAAEKVTCLTIRSMKDRPP